MISPTCCSILRLLFVFTLIGSTTNLSAQQYADIFDLNYRLSPANSYEDSTSSEFDIDKFNASFFLPLEADSGYYTLIGGGYSQTRFDDITLHSASLRLGFNAIWPNGVWGLRDWGYSIIYIPKLNMDDDKLSKKDFQMGLVGLFTKVKSDKLTWKFGGYLNRDRFGWLGVPLFGLKWQIDPTLQLDLTLPIAGTLRKTINDRFTTGLIFSGRKFSYNLGQGEQYMEVSDTNIWAFADLYLSKNVVLNLRAGHSFLRDYGIYGDEDEVDFSLGSVNIGDKRSDSPIAVSQGVSIQAGLLWRVHVE